ncbi:arylsulfatase J-like [Ischnura elegans]|uniref:arylsulfatase J-like n=1 Tax=Ischnura elegans TaxID=197161 RepID=UPI001ED86E0D|nr:arylsulfatase J-like [Ischnura elegans]XP_046395210.1 arylsulfatase J-like [Ischnura elegans]XP_046395211.1 arylsulfatase J-like [Ischnura elegans]
METKLFLSFLMIMVSMVLSIFGHQNAGRPHIIFILADDLGWNDVGFHGSNEIPTPNIDALAYQGIILNNYYVQPMCTPSRSALMSGKYPIHSGMQHFVLLNTEPRGLPLSERLLPEYLKDVGYATHAIGKWHLGFYKKEYTPEYRGFDSHFGHWTNQHDYFSHSGFYQADWGLDIHRGLETAWDVYGKYATELYTEEAVKIITTHKRKVDILKQENGGGDTNIPLFLYLSHTAVHSANFYEPLQAPDETVDKFSYIQNYHRRKYAAMVHWLDESVGKVVETLAENDMLNNSIIIFSTDNGGAPDGVGRNAGSNWPLRGTKFTLWEGGTRGAALIWSPLLNKRSRVAEQLMHISDWLPTLLSAVNASHKSMPDLDGHDLWKELSEDTPSSRDDVLLNLDCIGNEAALRVGDWKIIMGPSAHVAIPCHGHCDQWYGPSGLDPVYSYDLSLITNSKVNVALTSLGYPSHEENVLQLREKARINCDVPSTDLVNVSYDTDFILGPPIACDQMRKPCLFNLKFDPCEKRNLADLYPGILDSLLSNLALINETALPAANVPTDPNASPALWGYVWTNYGDKSVRDGKCIIL